MRRRIRGGSLGIQNSAYSRDCIARRCEQLRRSLRKHGFLRRLGTHLPKRAQQAAKWKSGSGLHSKHASRASLHYRALPVLSKEAACTHSISVHEYTSGLTGLQMGRPTTPSCCNRATSKSTDLCNQHQSTCACISKIEEA